ncbi:hypothetical protein SAMN03159423_4841 [Bradyrhizobium sp. NFR13]|nr:hypothetical protein SAMN03159423_4841 [Bradyrhizobium sp. NFR13]
MSALNGFRPLPPPDDGTDWRGPVKWPWFSARRRGHLLEERVKDLEERLANVERYMSGPPPRPRKK